uniref:Protein kinase domain-containing protein n=1 Tax=Buteo japonicus TaxID=224669 RepID=A0A8B9Z296_9AVES
MFLSILVVFDEIDILTKGFGRKSVVWNDKLQFSNSIILIGSVRGFAFVYEAQDLGSGKDYALKRLLSNEEEKNKAIIQEVCFMKKLSGHPNIVQFCSAASIGKEESDTGQGEFLLLTELCKGKLSFFSQQCALLLAAVLHRLLHSLESLLKIA